MTLRPLRRSDAVYDINVPQLMALKSIKNANGGLIRVKLEIVVRNKSFYRMAP